MNYTLTLTCFIIDLPRNMIAFSVRVFLNVLLDFDTLVLTVFVHKVFCYENQLSNLETYHHNVIDNMSDPLNYLLNHISADLKCFSI